MRTSRPHLEYTMSAALECVSDLNLNSSLCNLCVLCASVVVSLEKTNHRGTEHTEVAQRIQTRALPGRRTPISSSPCGIFQQWKSPANSRSRQLPTTLDG